MQKDETTFPKDGNKSKNQVNDDAIAKDYTLNQAPGDWKNRNNSDHDPDLKQYFSEYRTQKIYLYPLNRLFANQENKPKFSVNTIKIGFIDPDQAIESTAFEISDYVAQLSERKSSNINDNQSIFEMVDTKQIAIQENALPHNSQPFVISFNQPATEANLNNLYIINSYVEPIKNPRLRNTKSITVTKISDYTANNGYPIIVRIQKQLTSDTKITGIKIKYPQPALFGNIKLLGQANGVTGYDKSILNDDYINFPLLSMPIETDPKVRLLQWWFSDQILPWELAKQFITEKSVLDLLDIEPGTETRKQVVENARITQGIIATTSNTDPFKPGVDLWPISGDSITTREAGPTTIPHSRGHFIIGDNRFFSVSYGGEFMPGTVTTNAYQVITTTAQFGTIEYEIQDAPLVNTLQRVLLDMLSSTFNYYSNFPGALYDDNGSGNPANGMANEKQAFINQKPENVITNIFTHWENNNPNYKNNPKVKILKAIILMLSKNILSNLSINTGLNDDYKILLPYYFELVSQPLNHIPGETWNFGDCKVILKSEYFDFTEIDGKISIKMKNNDLSQNKLFHLDENQFNWLSIINELESNAIPSLLPPDWKLSDGEFTKYFTNLIIKKEDIELALELYGKLSSTLYSKFELIDIFNAIISNDFILINKKPLDTITAIEISGIFGNGNYDLSLLTSDKKEITINNLNLFSENEKISLIKIEI